MSTTQAPCNPLEKKREYRKNYYKNNQDKFQRYAKTQRAKNPEKFKADDRRRQLKSKYGLSVEQYEKMLSNHGGLCHICRTDAPGGRYGVFHVDHCHTSNAVRGLLCYSCNTLLGSARDNPAILSSAISYLKRFEEPHGVH